MKKLTRTLLLFALLCPTTAAQTGTPPAAPWRTYAPEGKEFSVEMPGVPRHRVEKITRPGVAASFHLYQLVTNSEVYFVGVIDMPPSTRSLDERLEFGINSAARQFIDGGGKEVSRRKFTSSFGCPGVAWLGTSADVPRFDAHTFVTHERIYLVVCASRHTGPEAQRVAERFLKSFNVPGAPCADKKTQ